MIAHPERPRAVAGAVPPSGHRFENGYGWPMIAHLCSAETTSGHSYTFSSFSFSEYLFTANLYTLSHWEVLSATPQLQFHFTLHMLGTVVPGFSVLGFRARALCPGTKSECML